VTLTTLNGFSWGIKGLYGPVPKGSSILLMGDVGSGLSKLSKSFVEDGIRDGDQVIYVSPSMSLEQFQLEYRDRLHYDAIRSGKIKYIDFTSPALQLSDLSHSIMEAIMASGGATRIIIDSLSLLAIKFTHEDVIKWGLFMKPRLSGLNVVCLRIIERGVQEQGFENASRALSECIVETSTPEVHGSLKERYRVVLCRGVRVDSVWQIMDVDGLKTTSF